jgi:hypothetical protein
VVGKLHAGNTNDFMGLLRNTCFILLETSVTLVGTLRVVQHQIEYVHGYHSHIPLGISGVP